jgi:hypothetical protein
MLPQQVIRSDGFVYMLPATQRDFLGRQYFYTGFENSAVFLGIVLPQLFGTSMGMYFGLSLIVMMFIAALFYVASRVIVKDRLISFVATFIFSLNYFGNFDMYSQHCYCFFMERVVTVPFMLVAFISLHLYLEKKIRKYLWYSLVSYFFGIGIGHFAVLFSAPYVLYPFFWYVAREKHMRKRLKGVWVGASYGLISLMFIIVQNIHESGVGPQTSPISFLLDPVGTQYPGEILRQFTHWTQYGPLLRHMSAVNPVNLLDKYSAEQADPIIALVYLAAFIGIWRVLPGVRAFLLTVFFGAMSVFYLNAWFGQYDVFHQPGTSRYLYFPNILLSFFWALFFWAIIKKYKQKGLVAVGIVMVLYFILNNWLISSNFQQIFMWDKSTKALFDHVTETRPSLIPGTLVVAPRPEFWMQEERFFTTYLGNGQVTYISENNGYRDWREVASSSAHVVKLRYDTSCECVKEEQIK